jgi:hypothetical protein
MKAHPKSSMTTRLGSRYVAARDWRVSDGNAVARGE